MLGICRTHINDLPISNGIKNIANADIFKRSHERRIRSNNRINHMFGISLGATFFSTVDGVSLPHAHRV